MPRPHALTTVAAVGLGLIVVGTVVGGPAGAANLITGKQIKDGTVAGRDVANGSLTGADVRDGSLTRRDFGTLPQGPQGPGGPRGATGARGPAGPVGSTGAPGPTGPTGPQDFRGLRGPNGDRGLVYNNAGVYVPARATCPGRSTARSPAPGHWAVASGPSANRTPPCTC